MLKSLFWMSRSLFWALGALFWVPILGAQVPALGARFLFQVLRAPYWVPRYPLRVPGPPLCVLRAPFWLQGPQSGCPGPCSGCQVPTPGARRGTCCSAMRWAHSAAGSLPRGSRILWTVRLSQPSSCSRMSFSCEMKLRHRDSSCSPVGHRHQSAPSRSGDAHGVTG